MKTSCHGSDVCCDNIQAPRRLPCDDSRHLSWSVGLQVWRSALWLGLGLGWVMAAGSLALAQADVESVLREFPKTSWYDPQSRQWLPPAVKPAEDEPLRQIGRVGESQMLNSNTGSEGNFWRNWNPAWWDLSWLGPWLRVVVFILLAILLAVSAAILTHFALRNYLPQRHKPPLSAAGLAVDPARIVDLPFDVAAIDSDPLSQARHHLQAGNFDAASVFLYGYLLLVLDQSRLIHLQKGKTNRMYLREVRGAPRIREILQQSMLVFESCYFGKHAVTRQQILAVWNTLDEFHQLLHAPQSTPGATVLAAEHVT